MIDPMLRRLIWKEYRMQRGFLASIAVFAVVAQLFVAALPGYEPAHAQVLFGFAMICSWLYALGCAATSFAVEHEEGTIDHLRNLAVPGSRVMASKIGFAAASTLALVVLLWLTAFALAQGQLPPGERSFVLWRVWGVVVVEALAWGLFFSLLTARPLNAVCLAAAVGLLVDLDLVKMASEFFRFGMTDWHSVWISAAPLRLAMAGVVLGADAWIALRWGERGETGPRLTRRPWRTRQLDGRIKRVATEAMPGRRSPLARLVWQEWRQAIRTMAVLVGSAAAVVALLPQLSSPDERAGFMAIMFALLPTLLGCCVFLAEQEGRRYRFFADRGVSPRRVWLGKHLVWLPVALAAPVLLHLMAASMTGLGRRDSWQLGRLFARALGWSTWSRSAEVSLEYAVIYLSGMALVALVGYGAGQFASMLIRRGLIAGIAGVVLALAFFLWLFLMGLVSINWLWSVLPIPLVLLLATWLRAPDWVLERGGLRRWGRLGAVVLVPATALFAGVATYRVYEVPGSGPGFDAQAFVRPVTTEDEGTVKLYREAMVAFVPQQFDPHGSDASDFAQGEQQESTWSLTDPWQDTPPEWQTWLKDNREALRITLEATRRPPFTGPSPLTLQLVERSQRHDSTLGMLLLLDAARLEAEGKLDDALERYLAIVRMARHMAAAFDLSHWWFANQIEMWAREGVLRWVAHPKQTPERIGRALRELGELFDSFPPIEQAIKTEYVARRRALEGEVVDIWLPPERREQRDLPTRVATIVLMYELMPWERTRAFRVDDAACAGLLTFAEELDARLLQGEPPPPSSSQDKQLIAWAETTPVLDSLLNTYVWSSHKVKGRVLRQATQRRALLLVLALKAWQAEHGELPETLDALVAAFFERLPLDPYSGEPFGYRHEGFPAPVTFGQGTRDFTSEPDEPLLWSVGPSKARPVQVGTTGTGLPVYKMRPYGDPELPHDAGWAFPLP